MHAGTSQAGQPRQRQLIRRRADRADKHCDRSGQAGHRHRHRGGELSGMVRRRPGGHHNPETSPVDLRRAGRLRPRERHRDPIHRQRDTRDGSGLRGRGAHGQHRIRWHADHDQQHVRHVTDEQHDGDDANRADRLDSHRPRRRRAKLRSAPDRRQGRKDRRRDVDLPRPRRARISN